MVSESKILTVSYGTFSCTLEGFDDPFSTMRSIAEYFRDLAAGDRYFGAEPPTPDAEMLHRIAEREIQHKVEARVEDDSIVLRQANSQAPAGVATLVAGEALLSQPKVDDPTDATETDVLVDETAKPTPVQDSTQDDAPVAEAADDAVLAAVQNVQDEPQSQDDETAADDSQPAEAETSQITADAVSDEVFSDGYYGAVEDDDHDNQLEDKATSSTDHVTKPQAEDAQLVDLSDTSIAAKLRRIRAVVDTRGEDKNLEDTEKGLADDFYVDALAPNETHPVQSDFSEEQADAAWTASEDATEEHATPTQAAASDDILSGISAALAEDDKNTEDNLQDAEIMSQSVLDDADMDSENFEDDDFEDDDFDSADENVFVEEAAEKPVAIARVVKVRRAAPEGPADITPDNSEDEGSFLSPEEEASLLAELAEVERDSGLDFEDDVQSEASAALGRTAFDDGDYAGTDALDRIMDKTNAKLDSDEVTQKRSSIAHLRAAVQAKRADTHDEFDVADDDVADDYRDDLARVVRPRRLGAGQARSARRLAPLVLVSEQRVDEPEPQIQVADQAPVRPRRIHKADGAAHLDGHADEGKHTDIITDFRAFAGTFGADTPAELLEAAAAFRTFIKGQETFSRPQVMNLMMKSSFEGSMSREEGLRAFGQLIREGVINKIQRGRYSVSENTRFRPDPERASA